MQRLASLWQPTYEQIGSHHQTFRDQEKDHDIEHGVPAPLFVEGCHVFEKAVEKLISPAVDPGTFFVKTAKMTSTNAAYCQSTFYEAWRLTIQRYGIYNPWTKCGAIEGLLPHGPHNVRDVMATHILKQTSSYEQASYAIQDTPEKLAQHYGRFLP